MKIYILLCFICIALVLTVNGRGQGSRTGGNNSNGNRGKPRNETNAGKPNKEKKAGGSKIGFFKRGGGFNIQRKNAAVNFRIFKIIEKTKNGTKNKFDIEDIEFNITREKNDSSYGVPAQVTTLTGYLNNSANISVSMIIFRQNGTVTTDDGYEFEVVEGTLKFNLDFNWPNEIENVDLIFGIKCAGAKNNKRGKKARSAKGKLNARKRKGRKAPESYSFCESVRVTFSGVYAAKNLSVIPRMERNNGTEEDNSTRWRDMPDGFPNVTMARGSGWSKVILRFEEQNVNYDPVMEVGNDTKGIELENVGSSGNNTKPEDKGKTDNKEKGDKGKDKKEKRAGGSRVNFYKKGGQFEMDRKDASVNFKIFKIQEKMYNHTPPIKNYNIEEVEFNFTQESNDSRYNVLAEVTTLSGQLENIANISLSTFIFRNNGTILTDDGYQFNVSEGTMKFSLDLQWPNEMEYVEVVMGFKCNGADKNKKGKKQKSHKGKANPAKKKGNKGPVSLGFCEFLKVTFSGVYAIQNKTNNSTIWQDMPNDFPKSSLSQGSGWSKVHLRFQGQNVVYDPVMEVGPDVNAEVESLPLAASTASTFELSVISLIFFANVAKYLL